MHMLSDLERKPGLDKAKTVICALIAHEGGKFEGKTRLNKAFWRAHVYHYQNGDGLLTQYPIARLPEGPAADDLDDLLAALEGEGRIELSTQTSGSYVEWVITLTSNTPYLREDEQEAIEEAIRWIKDKSANQVSDESHRLSRAWQTNRNGTIIDVQFDALNDGNAVELEVQRGKIDSNLAWADSALKDVFGD